MTRLLAIAAVVVGLIAPASANAWTALAQLNNDEWQYMTNQQCYPGTFYFRWLPPSPGKETTVRLINTSSGAEIVRYRLPASYGYWVAFQPPLTGACYRLQGRMPTEEGDMSNPHWFEWKVQ